MSIIKKAGAALATALTAALTGIAAQAAVVVSSPDDLDALSVGDAFSVIVASDDNQEAFDGFQFNLTYDASVIGYTGADFNDIWFLEAGQQEQAGAAGVITIENITAGIFDPSGTGLSGALRFVTLNFVVRDEGTSMITISPTAGLFLTLLGQPVEGGGTFSLTAMIGDDTPVDPIPLPGAALLFAPALAGAIAAARRASRQAA